MNIHLFFEGKLSREESSSAYLATLLEQWHEFRKALIAEYLNDELASMDWSVEVEYKEIDILLKNSNHFIIIENKVQGTSKSPDQVLLYYNKLKAEKPQAICHCLYVAPSSSTGTSELEKVPFDDNELSSSLSWEELFELMHSIDLGVIREFVSSGEEEVRRLIKEGNEIKYPLLGDKSIASEIVNTVRDRIVNNYQELQFTTYRGRNSDVFYTCKSAVTLSFGIRYEVEEEPPNDLIGSRDENGNLKLNVFCELRPSGKGSKIPEVKDWWDSIKECEDITIDSWKGRKNAEGVFWVFVSKTGEKEIRENLESLANDVLNAYYQLAIIPV